MTSLKGVVVASARAAGVDLVRFRSVRHAVGRRARLMASLGVNIVLDVGANRGQFGSEIRRAGYRGRIISIEPQATPYGQLVQLTAKDDLWTVIQSAVGSQTGVATIHVAANEGASSSLLPMLDLHARAAPEARYVAEEEVDVSKLDDLVADHIGETASAFLKVDVQGYELEVLKGASETLASSSLVQLEMSLLPLYEMAPTFLEVMHFMEERAFQLVGLEPGLTAPTGVLLQTDGLFAAHSAAASLQEAGW